ncbi:MAG: CvpA family protein [Candidatus Omnitrophica bacterium]|nr:CvpA family protein [Candidatus Omnitrophota bacterium]
METIKNFNWLDIVIVVILIRSLFLGIKTGLTAELFRFLGTVISLVVGLQWYSQIADILVLNLGLPIWLSQFLCFIIIVQLIRAIFKYGIVVALKVLNIQFILQLERIGGAVIGLGRGVIVAGIFVLALSLLPSGYIQDSINYKSFSGKFLMKAMERTYESITFWMPQDQIRKAIFYIPGTENIKLPKTIKRPR